MKERRPPPPMPALAKQPSTRPKISSVAVIAALTEAGSVTSQTRLSPLPDSPAMLAAAFLFLSALRPQIETLQPWPASACAMPSPIPPLPPVITATRPERSKRFMERFLFLACRASAGARKIMRYGNGVCFRHHGQDRGKNQICAPAEQIFRPAKLTQAAADEETMQFKHATLEFDGPVAVLRLDHQEVMNAVSMDMLGGLSDALDAIE